MAKKKPAAKPANLTALDARFAQEYMRDLNSTQSYLRCKPGVKENSARVMATRLLAKVSVQDEIARLRKVVGDAAGIDAATVVRTAWLMMTADAREFSELHVGCCRHCWGLGYRHQRTDGELADAQVAHKLAVARAGTTAERRKLGGFEPQGGGGFDIQRPPNPECPSCGGAGSPRTVFKDTRCLTPGAVQLFAGIKETKDGLEVKTHSKDGAVDRMFRHFGLYKDKVELTMPYVLLRDMTGRKGREQAP